MAGIYGNDGTAWAVSPGFQLYNYEFEMTLEDESKKKVPVNEFACALGATKGNRKGSEAGIRLANQKYILIQYNPEKASVYLAREGGGGACVAACNTAIVIGIWNKAAAMSDGKLQNQGDCHELVENMQAYLKGNGY